MLSQKFAEMVTAEGCSEPANDGAVTPGSTTSPDNSKEFLSTGRTGRRNAMHDILGEHMETGTADLPNRLEALTTNPQNDQSVNSNIEQNEPSTSQQSMG